MHLNNTNMACNPNYIKIVSWQNFHNHYVEFNGNKYFKFENSITPMSPGEIIQEIISKNCNINDLSNLLYYWRLPNEINTSIIKKFADNCGGLFIDIRYGNFEILLDNQRKMELTFSLFGGQAHMPNPADIFVYDVSQGNEVNVTQWNNQDTEKNFTVFSGLDDKKYLFRCPNLIGHLCICDADNYYIGFDDGGGFGDLDYNDAAIQIHIENV